MPLMKSFEKNCRKQADRLGMHLIKSKSKLCSIYNMQGYMIVDNDDLTVVAGSRYDLDLQDVAEFLDSFEDEVKKARRQKIKQF